MLQSETMYDGQEYVLRDALATAEVGRSAESQKTVFASKIRVRISERQTVFFCPTKYVGLRDTRILSGEAGPVIPDEVHIGNGDKIDHVEPGTYDVKVALSLNGSVDVYFSEKPEHWEPVAVSAFG